MIPLKLPTYQTSAPKFGPSYFANRYEYTPVAKIYSRRATVLSKYGSGQGTKIII